MVISFPSTSVPSNSVSCLTSVPDLQFLTPVIQNHTRIFQWMLPATRLPLKFPKILEIHVPLQETKSEFVIHNSVRNCPFPREFRRSLALPEEITVSSSDSALLSSGWTPQNAKHVRICYKPPSVTTCIDSPTSIPIERQSQLETGLWQCGTPENFVSIQTDVKSSNIFPIDFITLITPQSMTLVSKLLTLFSNVENYLTCLFGLIHATLRGNNFSLQFAPPVFILYDLSLLPGNKVPTWFLRSPAPSPVTYLQ